MKKPNLLFIFMDEQATETMAAYGNKHIKTPNFDRLANESILFENAYVTQSVCTPSRSSLMTGLYPHNTGCTENNISLKEDTKCLPELADFSGYKKAYHGKWHLGDEIFAQHGFDEWISIDDAYRGYYSEGRDRFEHSSYHQFLVDNGFQPNVKKEDGFETFSRSFCCEIPEQYSKPAFLANEACRFIRENRDESFMLCVNFFEPHMPYFSCRDGQYSIGDVPLPPSFNHEWSEDQPLKLKLLQEHYKRHGHSGLSLKTEEGWKRLIANYWGLNSLVDTHFGRILDELEACGLKEDTIIVHTSDHGDMMGSRKVTAKCVQYEPAVKIPLVMRIPGSEKNGTRVSNPVSQVDLIPTLIEAMGKTVPGGLDGYSLMDFIRNDGPLSEENVFIEWNGVNTGWGADRLGQVSYTDCLKEIASEEEVRSAATDPVRTIITPEGWKYTHSQRGEHELYNLREDPYETRNLVREPSKSGLVAELRSLIKNWQERTADTVPVCA